MTTVTIPKTMIANDKLIAIPRDIYEEFLTWQKKVKSRKTYAPTTKEKESLQKARENMAKGNFLTLEKLREKLGTAH